MKVNTVTVLFAQLAVELVALWLTLLWLEFDLESWRTR